MVKHSEGLGNVANRPDVHQPLGSDGVDNCLERKFKSHISGLRVASKEDHLRAQLGDAPNPFLVDRDHRHPRGVDIVTLLRQCVSASSSYESDRIYGLLGMTATNTGLHASDSAVMVIDYSKPAPEVFGDLTRYIARRDGCLAVLLLSGTYGGEICEFSLASWAVDWRRPTLRGPWLDLHQRMFEAEASQRAQSSNEHTLDTMGAAFELSLSGCIIGTVQSDTLDTQWHLWRDPSGDDVGARLFLRMVEYWSREHLDWVINELINVRAVTGVAPYQTGFTPTLSYDLVPNSALSQRKSAFSQKKPSEGMMERITTHLTI
ncbi:hypothetical protein LTR17_017185 [Elasticomyces elasticus]|nr:hypothetical protein LTR17_017185 [Elasticomyces elasticus]